MAQPGFHRQITEGVIWKQLLRFFFPILLGTFFQQMYNTADTIIVGWFVGTQALAAVGSTGPLVNLINGFFIGLSSGATVLLSQFFGANDQKGVSRALHTGMTFSLMLGLVTMAFGILAGPKILAMTGIPANCIDGAATYLRIYFSGAVASLIYNMGAGILRAMGDSRRPMLFLILGCLFNIGTDLLFVVVFRLGIAGAALATVVSQLFSAVLVMITLLRLPREHRLDVKKLSIDGKLLNRILVIGVPAGLQLVTFDLTNILIQSGINSFGDVTMAAWAAYEKTNAITWMISGAFGVAVTTFVGQNFGAQKYDRVRQSVRVCMAMSICMMICISALMLLFRETILGIYTPDAEVIRMGAYIITLLVPFTPVFMPVEVFSGTMRGVGCSTSPTVIMFLTVSVLRILWVLVMVSRWHTVEMLAVCYPISWTLAAIVFTAVYLHGGWLRRRIAACGMPAEVKGKVPHGQCD